MCALLEAWKHLQSEPLIHFQTQLQLLGAPDCLGNWRSRSPVTGVARVPTSSLSILSHQGWETLAAPTVVHCCLSDPALSSTWLRDFVDTGMPCWFPRRGDLSLGFGVHTQRLPETEMSPKPPASSSYPSLTRGPEESPVLCLCDTRSRVAALENTLYYAHLPVDSFWELWSLAGRAAWVSN